VTRRTKVLAVVLCCIALPIVLDSVDALAFFAATRMSGTVNMPSGRGRDYLLHVPPGYGASPVPLVISLHGAFNWPSFQMTITQWNAAADEHGFIVVYPAGDGGGPGTWSDNDVPFISKLIDELSAAYQIDRARIYATGLSNGGGMAHVLACAIPDRIAAIGVVSGAITFPPARCPVPKPVPMIAFHGTADRFTPYRGGKVWIAPSPFPSIPEWTASWAKKNGCAAAPIESNAAPTVTQLNYGDCDRDADVLLYTIRDGGHTWPGGVTLPEWFTGPTSNAIDATRVMWAFFEAHPRM
jgi:polyhydroxybutyrate depolymerase